MYTGKLIVVF